MIPLDKQAHFWAGMGIAATLALYTGNPLLAFVVTFLTAFLKETYDMTGKGKPDLKDALATVLGACVVIPLLIWG